MTMKLERAKIYRKKNRQGDDSYVLVLSTSKSGMASMYLAPKNASAYYENIDGIYFEEFESYAAFDRVLYIGWNKVNTSWYTEVATVPYRKINKITTAIKQFFDGHIVQNNRGHFYYFDELISSNDSGDDETNTTVGMSVSITSGENDMESDVSVSITAKQAPVIHHEMTEFMNKGYRDLLDEHGIPTEEEPKTSGTKYYNLLEGFESKKSGGVSYKTVGSSKKRTTTTYHNSDASRSMFTEEETLAIANMSTKMIMSKHSVTMSIASIMRRNARKHLDLEGDKSNTQHNKNRYIKLFDEGYSLDEVIEKNPEVKAAIIRKSYHNWQTDTSNTDHAIEYFDQVIAERNIDEMVRAVCMTHTEFRVAHKCTYTAATVITRKLKDILCINPLFSAGFEFSAYSDNIAEQIDAIRDSKRNSDIVTVANYDTCMRLQSVYAKTYNSHADILAGSIPVPSEIDESDRGRFLSLINNRFNRQYINKNRTLTNHQKDIIKNGDSVAVACEFMISYDKASSLRSKYSKR